MAEFSQLLKTVKGKALDAKILAGKEKLTFNFVKTSSHTYEESELETLEILEGVKQSVERTGIQIRDNHVVTIKAAFRNDELTEGYYIRAIGLYAIDPDEGTILYAVTVEKTGNCYISAYNQKAVNGISVKLNLKIDDADKVDLTIDPAAVATMQDILDLDSQKIPIQGGDISDTVINIENPPDEDKNPVKYPEIGDSGTTKSIMGQIRRWLKSLKDDKVDKKGGDTADTVVSGLTDSTASFPQPTAGDSQKTLWGKVKKWQQDCITKFGNYVLTSMITNQHLNSTSNIPTSALVYLMQQAIQQNQNAINVLNTNLKVEVGQATAWGAVINEQHCTKYGNHCDVYVRGHILPGPIGNNQSLFSLPWKIKDASRIDMECVMTMWNNDLKTLVPAPAAYNGQYATICITNNYNNANNFSFHLSYECD